MQARRILAVMAAMGLAAAAPGPLPKNLDRALDDLVTMDADKVAFSDVLGSLRKTTNTNIVVNWNALGQSGITRDTPLTLHVKDLSYEQLVKTLMDILPIKPPPATAPSSAPAAPTAAAITPGLHPNYSVGDNTLFITTNTDLGKTVTLHPYPAGRLLALTLDGESASTDQRAQQLEQIVRLQLARADEPVTGKGRALAIKGDTLAATVSERGHLAIARLMTGMTTPVKPGQMIVGIILTGSAKRTQDALAKLTPQWTGGALPSALAEEIARDPKKFATLNFAFIAGAAEALATEKPEISGTINDSGVILIGPTEALEMRTLLCTYDLRDLVKKQQAKTRPAGSAADAQAALVAAAKAKVTPGPGPQNWGDLQHPAPAMIIPYHGLLVVFATADTHRQLTAALQELGH